MKKAENVLPELKDVVAATKQGDPLITVGARVNDRNLVEGDLEDIWVKFTLNKENAVILARKLLTLVEAEGQSIEKRFVGTLSAKNPE